MKKTVIAAGMLLASQCVLAGEGNYLKFQYSQVKTETELMGEKLDAKPEAIHVLLGHKFNNFIGIEGLIGSGIKSDEIDDTDYNFKEDFIIGLSAVGSFPIMDIVTVYAKVGMAHVNYASIATEEADASGVLYGAGVDINVTESLGFGLEYVQYPDGKVNYINTEIEASAISASVNLRF